MSLLLVLVLGVLALSWVPMLRFLFSSPPDIAGFLMIGIAFVIALSLHEYGHALSATLQGDPTAKLAGRLTLNPKSHVDPFGAIMLVLAGFGWGKPVPFAPNKLSSPKWGAALVAIAGPAVNVALAFASAGFLVLILRQGLLPGGGAINLIGRFFQISLYLNVTLALFNLLPVPPLDGSRIIGALLPPGKQHVVYFLDRWGFVILLVVAFLLFPSFAGPLIQSAVDLVLGIVS